MLVREGACSFMSDFVGRSLAPAQAGRSLFFDARHLLGAVISVLHPIHSDAAGFFLPTQFWHSSSVSFK